MKCFAIVITVLALAFAACGPRGGARNGLRNATTDAEGGQEMPYEHWQIVDDQADLALLMRLRTSLAEAQMSMDESAIDGFVDELKGYLRAELDESKQEIKRAEKADAPAVERLKSQREETYRIAKEFRRLGGKRDFESLQKAASLLDELILLARAELNESQGQLMDGHADLR